MNRYVTDTHPMIWALSDDPRLSSPAKSVFVEADTGKAIIIIPPIVIVEMIYLSEKGRIPLHLVDDFMNKIAQLGRSYRLTLLGKAVIKALRQIPRDQIPEMPDRIIAATAKAYNCPLITRDGMITSFGAVAVLW
ncbi:MAG: PIN domain-containing protein [Acidobacteriota bacterium]